MKNDVNWQGNENISIEQLWTICQYVIYTWIPSTQPERAIKDCRNCKHGNYNDHWDTHFCYNPDNCVDWNLWEVKDIEPEIIKCKDCKYNTSSHKCINPDSFFLVPKDEDFCSYAKRREE